MDENNQRESIESERKVSIGTQDTTYDYDDEFWDSVWTILTNSYVILMYLISKLDFYWNCLLPKKIQRCVYLSKG